MNIKNQDVKKNESKTIIKIYVFLDWAFPFMMYTGTFETHENPNQLMFGCVGVLAICLTVWGIALQTSKKNDLAGRVSLYLGVSSIAYSWAWLWMYYEVVYMIADIQNPIYLIIGLLGYLIFIGFILHYRYMVWKGVYKNRGGAPNYSVIIAVAIASSIVAQGLLEKIGEDMQTLIMAVIALMISYVFSIGFAAIFELCFLKDALKAKKATKKLP